jgi:integrase
LVLRSALTDAERHHHVALNAAKLSNSIRVPHQRPKVLTPDEARAVVAALPDPGLRRMATVSVNCGLRQGELLALTWGSVNWETRELHVSQSLQRVDKEYRLAEVKSSTSQRTLPLTAAAMEALAQERRAQLEARLLAGGKWREPIAGLCFTSPTGQPRSGSVVTHAFVAALAKAGLPSLRWHDLRVAFGGLLLASGVDLAVISRLLGHSGIAITARTYAGVGPSLERDAADRLERALS